eukprot:jgi/Botrbrau1/12934/Bobra.92_1s0014.1
MSCGSCSSRLFQFLLFRVWGHGPSRVYAQGFRFDLQSLFVPKRLLSTLMYHSNIIDCL